MLDETDRQLLTLLVANSRTALKDLAQAVGMSSPSVGERLKRLEERGVVRAFTVEIDAGALGYQIQALVRVRPLPGKQHIVRQVIEETAEITECDKVTGEDCYVVRLFARSLDHLDSIVDRVAQSAETITAIVKSQPVRRRPPPTGLDLVPATRRRKLSL
jgi:Lrp/AsnC family leucine-responsive transcriptional regulator